MNSFQITRDIATDGKLLGDLVLWTGDAVLGKCNDKRGIQWFDTKCRDRGVVIKTNIAYCLIGRIPKDCDEIIRFSIDMGGDSWQITTDKHKGDDDWRSHGDIVLWTDYAKLYQDDNGKWWDNSCRDRGWVIEWDMVDTLFDKIPSWKDKEIIKFGIVINKT